MIFESYEQWLAASHSEREKILSSWCSEKREGFKFALMAAARLAFRLQVPIIEISVTSDHCGTWTLMVVVQAGHNPTKQEYMDEFESFRVIWFSYENDHFQRITEGN